jgi:antitoxin YefM
VREGTLQLGKGTHSLKSADLPPLLGLADADYTVISRRDAPDAVLMSLDTFNSLLETVHLLKSPANAAHLARSIEQYRTGQVQPRDLVDVGP